MGRRVLLGGGANTRYFEGRVCEQLLVPLIIISNLYPKFLVVSRLPQRVVQCTQIKQGQTSVGSALTLHSTITTQAASASYWSQVGWDLAQSSRSCIEYVSILHRPSTFCPYISSSLFATPPKQRRIYPSSIDIRPGVHRCGPRLGNKSTKNRCWWVCLHGTA